MIESIGDHYGLSALILEPDQWDKPIRDRIRNLSVNRIGTSNHFRSAAGRIEFVSRVAAWINDLRPQVVIIRCSWNIPVLLKLNYRPSLVIYHSTESTLYYGNADPDFNRLAAAKIDVIVFPEENRAAADALRCGFRGIPIAIAYNCPVRFEEAKKTAMRPVRNGRILYSGALDRNATFVDYYADRRLRSLPIDIYGYIGGSDAEGTKNVLESLAGGIVYKGYVDTLELESVRGDYAFSITMWNPSNENQRFACPCKFFESIASGVPPIAAPHPQCKMLIERYGCGIVMDDWSFKSFQAALTEARRIYGTPAYQAMVDGCRTATLEELNWDYQFARVRRLLPPLNP
ncbi:MAG: hypothetical protein SFV18_19940 [Bryobacteraceae bacterium]|nr:hypothetical protein [Bryobacteraceae bacterium]